MGAPFIHRSLSDPKFMTTTLPWVAVAQVCVLSEMPICQSLDLHQRLPSKGG
jgi:hypothetical protein